MGYNQQDNGKWKRKSTFLRLQVFSLTVENEKGEENYVREVQNTIMIRITVSISSCERTVLKFRPSQQQAKHQCLSRGRKCNSTVLVFVSRSWDWEGGTHIKGVSISALTLGSRILYCLIIISFTFDTVNFPPLLPSHICFVAQL